MSQPTKRPSHIEEAIADLGAMADALERGRLPEVGQEVADRNPFQFTEAWFTLGVVDAEVLARLRAEWDRGEDDNPEHYRHWAFKEFLARKRPLDPVLAAALYELGAGDADPAMGGAMMAQVLYLPECPASLLQSALTSDRKHLVRIAERRLGAVTSPPPAP